MEKVSSLYKSFSKEVLFHKADHYEVSLCHKMNRMGYYRAIRLFFKAISRLGDGVFWYSLALLMPIALGVEHGLAAVGHMTVTAVICLLIYSQLKNRLVRQRPFISFKNIEPHTAPLDLYSFPSGHTMNAVNFAILFSWFYPPLAGLVITFAILVALSRVILGMHYPTDVLVGTLIGATIAYCSLKLAPLGMFSSLIH